MGNINFTLRCDTCSTNTNVRFGLSNRGEQPVRFACKTCSAPIDIVIGGKNAGITGAQRIANIVPFDAETNFVDLHLDFPVSFAPYEMGMTPFMRAMERVGRKEMALHVARLNHLNKEMAKARQFATLLKLFANGKILPFKLNIKKTFGIQVRSDLPQDLNAAIYSLIAWMMMPYEVPHLSHHSVEQFQSVLSRLAKDHKPALDRFVTQLVDSGFLKNLQHDVLEIYPRMLAAELAMRPALFLDLDTSYAEAPVPMRVSAQQFEDYKDLYKDIAEIVSREFVLVAGLNILLHRGNANSFAPRFAKNGRDLKPADLDNYADVPFGQKQDDLDNPWFQLLDGSTGNRLRNAIAHYKAEYDDVMQRVTYYGSKEGMAQEKAEEISFLEFMRRLLTSYREMHRLHHLIKILFYYYYLVLKKGDAVKEA